MRTRAITLIALTFSLAGALIAYAQGPTLDATIRTWVDDAAANNGAASGTAACESDERATGGGVYTTGSNASNRTSYTILLSGPTDETGTIAGTETGDVARRWSSSIRNGTAGVQPMKGFVLCSKNSDATVVAKTVAGVNMGDKPTETVMCASGARALGGGVHTTTGTTPVNGSAQWSMDFSGPVDSGGTQVGTTNGEVPRGWTANILNQTGSTQTVRFFVICSVASDATLATKDVSTSPNGASGTFVRCPGGRHITGGGVLSVDANFGAGELQYSGPVNVADSLPGTTDGDVGRSWYGGMGNGSSAAYRVAAICEGDAAPAATVTPSPSPSSTPGPTATPTTEPAAALAMTVQPASVKVRKRKTFTFSVTSAGAPVAGASVLVVGRTAQTSARGTASIRMRFNSKGAKTVRATKEGFTDATATIRVKKR